MSEEVLRYSKKLAITAKLYRMGALTESEYVLTKNRIREKQNFAQSFTFSSAVKMGTVTSSCA